MTRNLIYIIVIAIAISCKKKEIGPQCPTCMNDVVSSSTDVLIGCEGNFGWGNASLTLYNPENFSTTQQVFQNVNGFNLGDVLQSFCQWQEKLYIILNNSGKIEIVDTSNYQYLGTINGLTSPRYMVTKGNIGYVSDLYSNSITTIDLLTNTVTGSISTGRWTEHLLIDNNFLYITCPDTTWVLKYDLFVDSFIDTIVVGKAPSGIQKSNDGNIWVLTSGGYNQEIPKLISYDGSNITKNLSFSSTIESPSNLMYNSRSNLFFYLNNGLFTYDPNAVSLSLNPSVYPNNSVFYGLGIDPNNSDIYITDAVDYVQQGRVFRFDSVFNAIDTFNTGFIPQAVWFK
ncbi:MAG: YncE family protein [Flavobacteriales bacterium]|nr:YncE family protein [Flavobacteriales bacterium]